MPNINWTNIPILPEDLEQAQAEHVALNPRLSRIITRIVRSVLGPEVCRRLRYHLSVVNNIGDALKASIAKLISITQTVCDIFDLVFHGHQHLEANESNLHISTSAVAEDQHELQVAM